VYRWIEHTGELELEIVAPSQAEVFAEGFAAMRELLDGAVESEPEAAFAVRLDPTARELMLADWLGEIAYLAETEGLVPKRLASLNLGEAGLAATIEGSRADPAHLVKAITYHRLTLERTAAGWRATVVLDV
jgi:SHS2 domain-containing protein